jgi:5-methylcytosine-specific restriction protein A
MDNFFTSASEAHVKKEKAKARELRNSQWWKNQLSLAVCHYCENRFPVSDLTMDHRIPIIRGGFSTRANVVVACKPCNTAKKYHLPSELALASLKTENSES